MSETLVRAKYTPEFRLEAVWQAKAGESVPAVVRVLGIPKASLGNWVRAGDKGELRAMTETGTPVTPEQMELARLRADVARLRMERDIAKKAAAYFAQDVQQGTPGFTK